MNAGSGMPIRLAPTMPGMPPAFAAAAGSAGCPLCGEALPPAGAAGGAGLGLAAAFWRRTNSSSATLGSISKGRIESCPS